MEINWKLYSVYGECTSTLWMYSSTSTEYFLSWVHEYFKMCARVQWVHEPNPDIYIYISLYNVCALFKRVNLETIIKLLCM